MEGLAFSALDINFAPLLEWWQLWVLAGVGLFLILFGIIRFAKGIVLRGLLLMIVWLLMANPSVVEEQRVELANIVLIIVDESSSQTIGERRQQSEKLKQSLLAKLGELSRPPVPQIVTFNNGDDGSRALEAIGHALSQANREQIAGIFLISDGQIHGVPKEDIGEEYLEKRLPTLPSGVPVHGLITGDEGETDWRLRLEQTPRFGIVDQAIKVQLKADHLGGDANKLVTLDIHRDGTFFQQQDLKVGDVVEIELPLDHAGENIFEFSIPETETELTPVNNRVVASINGVREALNVLLISGKPHQGSRVWRNLLKSDPTVELVHYQILKNINQVDQTPLEELSLIPFPLIELFEDRLYDFDLVILDHYPDQPLLPVNYFDLLSTYVREGGALLVSSGPPFAGPASLYNTALRTLLPMRPNGQVRDQAFVPKLTDLGSRHPLTGGLENWQSRATAVGNQQDENWGPWFRQIGGTLAHADAQVLLDGKADTPLLAIRREGEGRVAHMLSDQVWLWAKGYQGGGPHSELLRNIAHWLMREPDLEEEHLVVELQQNNLLISRQSLLDKTRHVNIEFPNGTLVRMPLTSSSSGVSTGELAVKQEGLYRIWDEDQSAFALVGGSNPLELQDLRSSIQPLGQLAELTGGHVRRISPTEGGLDIRLLPRASSAMYGRGWLGIRDRNAQKVTGLSDISLLPGVLAFFILALFLVGTWLREAK